MFATGVTMGLAEWIIDNTCLFLLIFDVKLKWASKKVKVENSFLP